jgi:CheY-like chemotaxis protein
LSVIEDILDVARIEAGRFELSAEPVALPKLITLVADLVRVSAEQKGVRFTYELPLDLPGVIVADEKRLRQVLLNLLGNAVKFTDRGAVTLQIEPLPAPAARARLRFEVRDTGVGIPADKLDAIFQPFEQAGERMQRIGGTGLGLTISRQLVRAMGGEIRVESTPGQGSRFRFELEFPLGAAAAAGALRAPEIVGYEGPRRKVLIVDDVEENRALLRQLLTRLEFNVYEAADGENGIAVAQATRPDLILLDSVMPVMDGIEATRRLRAIPEQSAVPIIVISAATSSTDRERSLANGASAFLAKPVVLHGLLQEMGSLLRLTWKY